MAEIVEDCEVSFILLCSGTVDARSFRPDLDDSQWWGRRDALVRCASVLWAGHGVRAPSVREVCLLHSDDLAVLRITVEAVDGCPTPTEHALVGAWRAAAEGRAVRGVRCERDVWRAAILEADAASACRPSSASHGGATTAADSARPVPSSELEQLDKREILAFLHTRCDLPFLRAHGLNSGTDVVLKKCNKAKLIGVYSAWLGAGSKGVGDAAASAAPVGGADAGGSAKAGGAGVKSAKGLALQRTFEHLLRQCGAQASGRRGGTAVLLLHEDCAHELPVFGRRAPGPDRLPPAHVVAVLGAVRDMSGSEDRALGRACASLGLPLLGANLGRTAEFTSKIMAALAFHARAGVLGPAVARLLGLEGGGAAAIGHGGHRERSAAVGTTDAAAAAAPAARGGSKGVQAACTTVGAGALDPPAKLPPVSRARLAATAGPPAASIAVAPAAASSPPLLHVVAGMPFAAVELDAARDLGRGSVAHAARERVHPMLRLAVCALWRSRLAGEAEAGEGGGGGSATLLPQETAMAGPTAGSAPALAAAAGVAAAGHGGHGDTRAVCTALTLVFSCGAILSLSQASLVRKMAARHHAAPTEAQLLTAICEARDALHSQHGGAQLGGAQPARSQPAGQEAPVSNGGLSQELARALRQVACGAAHPTLLRLEHTCGQVDGSGARHEEGAASCDDSSRQQQVAWDLAAEAYSQPCACSRAAEQDMGPTSGADVPHVVLLCPARIEPGPALAGKAGNADGPTERVAAGASRLLPSADDWAQAVHLAFAPAHVWPRTWRIHLSSSAAHAASGCSALAAPAVSPALAVTMVQHYAYHGRLVPALRALIRRERPQQQQQATVPVDGLPSQHPNHARKGRRKRMRVDSSCLPLPTT